MRSYKNNCRYIVGSMKEFAKKFYKSKNWEQCRDAYISKRISFDGGLCEVCHELPGYIVHHRIHLNPANINDPDITLNDSNLQYVCHECHNEIHSTEFVNGISKRNSILVDGRLKPFDDCDDGDRFKRR